MSQQKAGYVAENDLVKEIYDQTDGDLFPIPVGMSGNHNVPAPDIVIDDGVKVHAFELKTTSKDRISVMLDPDEYGKVTTSDDLSQLIYFGRNYPRTVVCYVGVSFNRRQLLLVKLWHNSDLSVENVLQSAVTTAPSGVDVSVTYANNLSVQKPDTDGWPSAAQGDDIEYLLDTINYDPIRYQQ